MLEMIDAPSETDADGWYCEDHPQHLMGHGGCRGAGILGSARIYMLVNRWRLAEQRAREAEMMRDDLAFAMRRLMNGGPIKATAANL